MNYQSAYQGPLNGMDYQFQNLKIDGSGRGTPLAEAIGTQFGSARGWRSGVGGDVGLHESGSSSPYPSQLGTPSMLGGSAKVAGAVPLHQAGMGHGFGSFPAAPESQWRYVDTQGQIQGPFASNSMSQWYASGYFQQSLQISRVGTSFEPFGINDSFITLGELIAKVNDFQDPFLAFDRVLASMNSAAVVAGPGIDMSLLRQQPVAKQAPVARVESTDFTHDQILGLEDSDGGRYREVVVQIPVSKKNLEKLQPEVKIDTTVPSGQAELVPAPAVQQEQATDPSTAGTEPVKAEDPELKRQRKAEEMARKLLEEQQRLEEEQKRKEELRKLKKQQKQKTKSQKFDSKTEESGSTEAVHIETGSESSAPKTPMAPWAKKAGVMETPKISIPELQRREEQELAKKQQERQRLEQAAALQLQEQVLKEEKAQKEMKSVLTWANKPAPPPVAVDLKATKSKTTTPGNKKANAAVKDETPDEFSDPSFLKEQAKLWENAQREKARRQATSAAGTIHADSGNDWITISAKSNHSNNNQQKVVNQPKSYINPDKLRAVGGTVNRQIGSSTSIPSLKAKYNAPVAYPGNNSISVRQDFLRWCKSQMKLNPSVEAKSVLEVLLSLPAGPEAKEIIADTIYSNSSTMDGRRFATEFIKRRVECEKLVKDPLTWSEALALPEGNEDDWEFQVVSKKKGRKHRAD
ncbi:hypothetical protein HG536_0A06860 [Torulaspora globosa]|uniref:GYF domain-containing protein n=1 Tax=Torulaspora globosa TaxID=48254 RepID=A0A7G3ZBI5_9SACH|nr:uncharacterized protein HG536_0A06860 [Torulaspora globosa]QLL30871.1 hypothetical protein HG536_0A06860 [Torulaspora globosa]